MQAHIVTIHQTDSAHEGHGNGAANDVAPLICPHVSDHARSLPEVPAKAIADFAEPPRLGKQLFAGQGETRCDPAGFDVPEP
jgi:5,10-methenyltetrahydromethanopterin hydrogenase